MSKFLSEFKQFAMRGNVLDMAADLPRLLHRGFLYLHADQTGQQVCQEEGGRTQARA
mgnify:CR=1 FL=1